MVVTQFNARSQVALVFFLLLLLFNVTYSLQYKIPAPQIPVYFGAASIAFFTLLAVFGFSSLARAPKVGTPLEGLGALMCVIGFLVVTIYLNVPLPFSRLAVVIGVMAGSAILVARLAGPLVALVLLLFVGMAAAIVNGLRTPLDIGAANMLPIIQAACVDLKNGISPYGKTYPLIASLPMYYLPGALLPYCGLEWNGLDLRWLNSVAYIVIGAAALAFALRSQARENSLLLIVPLLVSPSILLFMAHAHEWLYWIVCLATALFVLKDRFLLAGLFAGLMLATRQHALFLALPMAAVLLGRVGPVRTLAAGSLAVLVIFVVGVWPSGFAPLEYVRVFYLDVAVAGATANNSGGNPYDQIALSGMLLKTVGGRALSVLQVLAVLGGSVACWRLHGNPRRATIALGLTYVVAIALNSFLSRYLYMPGFFLMAFGAMLPAAVQRVRH